MKRHMPVTELARDERFARMRIEDLVFDPRNAVQMADDKRGTGFRADNYEAPDAARALMHGIFVGEIQALEGAGRTCWDFDRSAPRATPCPSSSSSTWPASAGTRPATSRSR